MTAWNWISIDANNEISNTLPWAIVSATAPSNPTEWMVWYDTTEDSLKAYNWTSWETEWTEMVVLSYWHSTWQEFIDAYNKNAIVYCKASSQSNPWSWNQTRMAFMAYVNSATPTEVEFQYYRSRSDHNTAANQLDQVFVYKLTSASWWTWTVTERNTWAKAVAWTWISLWWGSGNMTISADTSVLATKTDLNSKQDTLVSWTNIKTVNSNSLLGSWDIALNDVKVSATAPSSPTEWMTWYDTTNDQLKVYDGTNWQVTGKEYTAWDGILIWSISISSRQWPCEEWFHVPSAADWQWVWNIMNAMNPLLVANWGPRKNYLHMPYAWGRDWNSLYGQGSTGAYWSSSKGTEYTSFSCMLLMSNNYFYLNDEDERSWWHSIRAFKNEYVAPDNTWTVVFGTLWNSWIFWNQTEWLITITNGTTGYTMMDKNIGATVVYNDGDTLSEANCGKYFQRWNNYWFPRTWNVTTSNTAVNTVWYGPSNPYSDDTFIVSHEDWSANDNWDLWWDITNSTTIINNVISNTGVLSVNGQTGNVTIEAFQLAPNSPLTPKYRRYWSQAQYDALTQYYTDNPGDTVYFTI